MNYLFQLDTNLFLFINHLPHNLFSDDFFGALSFIGEYGAVWFLISFFFFFVKWKKLAVIWGTGIIALLLTFVLKEIFQRVRPEFVLPNVILPFGQDKSFSFPSGHTLVSFAFATILTNFTQRLPRRLRLLAMTGFYILAILISFSRIYLGYHYPLDVLTGAIIGIVTAWAIRKLLLLCLRATEK